MIVLLLIVEYIFHIAIDRRRALNGHARNDSYQYMAVDNEIPKQEKSVIEPSTTDEKANNEISSTPVDMKRWVADESETTCQICKIQVFSIVCVVLLRLLGPFRELIA